MIYNLKGTKNYRDYQLLKHISYPELRFEAVEKGDMEKAQRMVDEAAKRAGYVDDESWKISHHAPDASGDNSSLDDISEMMPGIYGENAQRYYGSSYYEDSDNVIRTIQSVHGNPDAKVTIYRAVPKDVKDGKARNGDWVTLSREYAQDHGESNINGKYRIIEQEVPAKHLYSDGNSIFEMGYDDGQGYVYRNTKNNRKLNDAVTYDDNGNVIPLSKRFNFRNSDERFSLRDSYDTKMSKWKARNGLADDAQPMEKPVRGADESIGDFMNRMAQYAKDQALWKTAPRPTGFSEALEQWKRDNGIPADEFRPSIPRKADYATDDEYRQARDQYKQEMEKWKGAPKASDYDLSVELDKLSTQMRAMRAAMINQRSFDRQTVKGATDMI